MEKNIQEELKYLRFNEEMTEIGFFVFRHVNTENQIF